MRGRYGGTTFMGLTVGPPGTLSQFLAFAFVDATQCNK